MTHSEMVLVLSNLSVSDHKAMRKALRVLLAVGMDQFTALTYICEGLKQKQIRQSDLRMIHRSHG